jgi:O-antigen/teichoic acid export membrane protein
LPTSQSLKKITIKGLSWSLIESASSQGIRFVLGIILARLLVPEMFGLIAMLLIFITLGEIFVDSGFGTALIQKQKITECEICSVFYFNILVGLIAATLLFLAAPAIAAFYNQPTLTPIAQSLSFIFIINSFGMIQSNLLVKGVDFKSMAKLITISNLSSGLIGIALAVMGYGIWSLVIQQISAAVIRNCLYWYYSSWRPHFLFSINEIRKMLRFSLSILAIGILNRTSESIYYMVIGKLFSATDLGFFSRANQLQSFPSSTLAMLVGRVTFPVYAKVQHDPLLLKAGLRKTLTMLAFIIFPIMVGVAVVAKPLIIVLLTDKWAQTIPYLQLLSVVGVLFPFEWIRQQALQAVGRPDLSLRVEIFKKVALFASITVMWQWGIFGIISGMIFATILSLSLNIHYTAMVTQYSIREQLFDMIPYFAISIIMGAIAFSIIYLIANYSAFYQLLIQSFTGFLFYVGITWLFHTSAIKTIQQELPQLFRK